MQDRYGSEGASRDSTTAGWLRSVPEVGRRRVQTVKWTLVLGSAGAVFAVVATLNSSHVRYPAADAVFLANMILGLSIAGAAWMVKRPDSSMGLALAMFAATGVVVALQSVEEPLIFSIGVLGDWPAFIATVYVLVAFPSGRITRWTGWLIIGFFTAVLALFFLPYVLLSPVITGGHPLAECSPVCPDNGLQVGAISLDGLLEIGRLEAYGATIGGALLAAWLLYGLVVASRPRRRTLIWVSSTGIAFAVVFAVRQLTAFVIDAPPDVTEPARWSLAVLRTLLPWAFIAALVDADMFAGRALRRMLNVLSRRPTVRDWEIEMAAALDDPRLRIGFWSVEEARYIGTDGRDIDGERGTGDLRWLSVDEGGRPAAGILHDSALDGDPELLAAAARATLIARTTIYMEDEIVEARARALSATADERKRLERDLHDGAQQRLIALRIRLGIAAEEVDGETRQLLEELGADVGETLNELRRFGQGAHSSRLAEEGLEGALRRAARQASPLIVRVRSQPDMPALSHEVKAGVYFTCVEALQNAAKYAGRGATATVWIAHSEHGLRFAIDDDGGGFDPTRTPSGSGLTNIRQRVAALGGSVDVVSHLGEGTSVRGRVPLRR